MPTAPPVPLSELLKRKHAWLGEMNALLGTGPLKSSLTAVKYPLPTEVIEEATGGLWGAIERAWRRLLARLTISDSLDADGIRALLARLDDVQARIDRWRKVNGPSARAARAQVKRGELGSIELARRLDEVDALEPAVKQHKAALVERAGWLDALEQVVVDAVPLDAVVLAWGPPPAWKTVPVGFSEQADEVEAGADALKRRLADLPRSIQGDPYLSDRLDDMLRACRAGRVRARTLEAQESGDVDELTEVTSDGLTERLSEPSPSPVLRSTDPTAQAYRALVGLVRQEARATLPPPGVHPSEQGMHRVVELADELPPDFGLGTDTPDEGAPPPPETDGSKRLAGVITKAVEAMVGAVDQLPGAIRRLCGAIAWSSADWSDRAPAYANLIATHWQIPLLVRTLSAPLARIPKDETEEQRADRGQRASSVDDLQACLHAVAAGAIPSTARARRMTPEVVKAVRAGIDDFWAGLRALDRALRDESTPKTGDAPPVPDDD